jgi:hypothetical protein
VAGGIDIDGTMFDLLELRNKIGLGWLSPTRRRPQQRSSDK